MTLNDLGVPPEDPTYRWEYFQDGQWKLTLLYLTEKTAAKIFVNRTYRKAPDYVQG